MLHAKVKEFFLNQFSKSCKSDFWLEALRPKKVEEESSENQLALLLIYVSEFEEVLTFHKTKLSAEKTWNQRRRI